MQVRFPGGCITLPAGQTPEQVRRGLQNLGYTNVATAPYTVDGNGDITFTAPVGGAKGR